MYLNYSECISAILDGIKIQVHKHYVQTHASHARGEERVGWQSPRQAQCLIL